MSHCDYLQGFRVVQSVISDSLGKKTRFIISRRKKMHAPIQKKIGTKKQSKRTQRRELFLLLTVFFPCGGVSEN